MSAVGLTARFPLGVYQGHASDGSPDLLPSPARLFSALVSAAHTGTTAGREGEADPAVLRALNWLEEHPPSGLHIPVLHRVAEEYRVAYRKTGALEKQVPATKSKAISDGVALDGVVGWTWSDMPDHVRQVLGRLCEDVPCLGETESPVVLEIAELEPNWILDPKATAFSHGARRVPVAGPGRHHTLEEAHARTRPARPPSIASDKPKSKEEVLSFPTTDEALSPVHYTPVEPPREDRSPWRDVLVLPADDGTGQVIAPERRVAWCVAFHRALISLIGDGAPAVVTGRYPGGAVVPPNRVGIQYLPASVLAQSAVSARAVPGAFLVLLPRGMDEAEASAVLAACQRLRHVRSRWADARLRVHDEIVDAAAFWRPPAEGVSRLWSPMPAAIPEVVKQRGRWTFEDAILLSLGFVWRDALEPVGRGAQAYRSLVSQVRERGAGVAWYRHLTHRPEAYVHKMPPGMTAQPYLAQIFTGSLVDDTTLACVGQSRHLGGGLLVPVDMPSEVAQATLKGAR